MKVQLVVVQGKPEGKTIPLAGPNFKIGRGEGCHLRPNSDLVSREHAEFALAADSVSIRDLGSRNGTDVNGKPLPKGEPHVLKNGDLVKIGSLTFAVSIEGVPAKATTPAGPARKASLDDVNNDEIDAWLVSDEARPTPDRPSGVYGGETITVDTFKELSRDKIPPRPPSAVVPAPAKKVEPEPVAEPEPEPEVEPEPVVDELEQYSPDDDDGIEDLSKSGEMDEMPEEFIDESNPFYVKKKEAGGSGGAVKPSQKDSSDAAGDILRKMMDRRKASKS